MHIHSLLLLLAAMTFASAGLFEDPTVIARSRTMKNPATPILQCPAQLFAVYICNHNDFVSVYPVSHWCL